MASQDFGLDPLGSCLIARLENPQYLLELAFLSDLDHQDICACAYYKGWIPLSPSHVQGELEHLEPGLPFMDEQRLTSTQRMVRCQEPLPPLPSNLPKSPLQT